MMKFIARFNEALNCEVKENVHGPLHVHFFHLLSTLFFSQWDLSLDYFTHKGKKDSLCSLPVPQ